MQLVRYFLRLYLSKIPITEGKKYIYMFAKKYFIPKQSNVISKMKHGFYLKLNLQNPEHQYYYFYMSHDERYEINNLQNIIQSSDICWDIGANIGFYSFLFLSIVKDGEVVAFEPISKTYDDLKIAKEITGQMADLSTVKSNPANIEVIWKIIDVIDSIDNSLETNKVLEKTLINLRKLQKDIAN